MLLLVSVFGDDGFPVGIQERGESAAVPAVEEQVVHACFLVDYNLCIRK